MNKLRFSFVKKQLPQFVIMVVLALALFGYFAWRLTTPPPAERSLMVARGPFVRAADPQEVELAELTDGDAPTVLMRNPFVAAQPQQVALQVLPTSSVAPLMAAALTSRAAGIGPQVPYSSAVRPLSALAPVGSQVVPIVPIAPPIPSWTVTGILSGPDANCKIAVLRNGDARKFVRVGGIIDGQLRLVGVDRYGALVKEGAYRFRLLLGGSKPPPPDVVTPAITSVNTAP